MAAVWRCAGFEFDLDSPVLMGICNVTPDSFSDGGAYDTHEDAIAHAHALLEQGVHIIDVGGESTRPGAEEVSASEELERVLPVVSSLARVGVAVSIDTRHAQVARACVDAGACIINDVSGFRDRAMRELASSCDSGLVVMHMRGEPKTMQEAPVYDDVVFEVRRELERMAARLCAEGVDPLRICLDPGIGFGKNLGHNLALVQATSAFAKLGYPLMAAVSRKSFIGLATGVEDPVQRDEASALCAAFMVGQGARVLRVHNVEATCVALAGSRRAIIGLGSNMGDSYGHLDDAIATLMGHPGIWVACVSEYVESEPAYLDAQPTFVNAVACLQTTLTPMGLLDVLHQIEDEHGRVRSVANGPRTLDLDIVDYEGVVSADETLTLPHPLALERDFVVTPLLAIMPGFTFADGTKLTGDHVSVGRIVNSV